MRISSQRYIDQEIVDRKIAEQDFTVTLAEIENEDGDEYDLVIDGHHSLEAAHQSGNAPDFQYADYDYQKEVEHLGFDDFLAAHHMDSDWYNIETGENVW
jgi:hypothetical protein